MTVLEEAPDNETSFHNDAVNPDHIKIVRDGEGSKIETSGDFDFGRWCVN